MRIQIMTLPSEKAGEFERYPFALILDRVEEDDLQDATVAAVRNFAEKCGARASLVVASTVEVA